LTSATEDTNNTKQEQAKMIVVNDGDDAAQRIRDEEEGSEE
jgi:hypothetical protein